MPEFGCKLWALEPSVTAMSGPEVDPTRGPPPNQGSQGSPFVNGRLEGCYILDGWELFQDQTFWKPIFFMIFFGCENVDINGSLNRRLNHVVQISCQKLCCFFQCSSVKVVPEDDP